jgi:hypothetical protein
MMFEKEKPIPDYPGYFATTDGIIYSYKKGKELLKLKQAKNWAGYVLVSLRVNGKSCARTVHSLVLSTFSGPRPIGYSGAHLNGKRDDNRLENLKWVTTKENETHKRIHGTMLLGERCNSAKLNPKAIKYIRANYKRVSYRESNARKLAKRFGVTRELITAIVRKELWKEVT